MSDPIHFDAQSKIIERLHVKSLIQFRSVSKDWRSLIDSLEFIKNYHVNHTNPQHCLLVSYELDNVKTYTSIIDNNTFPEQRFLLTAPDSLRLLRNTLTLGSVDGLLCFCGDVADSNTMKVVIWNPAIRKSVDIDVIPKEGYERTIVGFGVCPDPKLVKISVTKLPVKWEVEVFTLSTRDWRTVYTGAPFKSCDLTMLQVFVNGVIYFRAYDDESLDIGVRSNFVISFDLKSDEFEEVHLPESLLRAHPLNVTKVNESLGLLEFYNEDHMWVSGVWSRQDGVNEPFTKMYTIRRPLSVRVLGFRNNGEVVIEVGGVNSELSGIRVYDPLSGQITGVVNDVGINDVGINGYRGTLSVNSYTETLLLA